MSTYLTASRIEFIVTYRCNAHWTHGQVDDEARRSGPAAIDADLATHVVRRTCEACEPRSVMTFGGEPQLAAMARSRGVEPETQGHFNVCDACCALRKALASATSP